MVFLMYKIKPVVNRTCQYFDVSFYSITCTHSNSKRSHLVIYWELTFFKKETELVIFLF